jgi:hypothetical protein
MRSRLVPVSIALAVTLAVTATAAIGTSGEAPAKVHPKAFLVSAKSSGKSVRFVVEVTFPVLAGIDATSACKGQVKLTEKARPHHKAPHWSAGLAPHGELCEARIKGKLPAGLFNKRVAFKISFPGNGTVGPFSAPKKLKLSPSKGPQAGPGGNVEPESPGTEPNPVLLEPYTAANGHWSGATEGGNISFEVKEAVIKKYFSTAATPLLTCEKKDDLPEVHGRYFSWHYERDVPLDHEGNFSDEYLYEASGTYTTVHIIFAVHGNLGSSTGTMVLEMRDGVFSEHSPEEAAFTLSECHLSLTFKLSKK